MAVESKKMMFKDKSKPKIPFEKLPNLPKPVFTPLDLGIAHMDLGFATKSLLALQPTLADRRRVGYFKVDQTTQTEESDIVELKRVTGTIGTLMEDIERLRQDLSYTQHIAKRDYENQIDIRALELYAHANERIKELEKIHAEKIETIRKSYRSQLSNAISKIAGEYKVYYEEILQGRTGHHDTRIRELKQTVERLEHLLEVSEGELQGHKEALAVHKKKEEEKGRISPHMISLDPEMEHELRMNIVKLENELDEAQVELASKEDSVRKYRRQSETLLKQLEEEKSHVVQFKVDLETLKATSAADKERSEKLAQGQRDALEKEMLSKVANEKKEAATRAEKMAELQRLKELARHQQQEQQKNTLEEQLRKQNRHAPPPPAKADSEVSRELEKLRTFSTRQEEELVRLTKQFDRSNRVWETKLSIMQKNFHALKDESYLRQQFQRQSALLHYATVGYAVTNPAAATPPVKQIRAHPRVRAGIKKSSRAVKMDASPFEAPPAPTPTPVDDYQSSVSPEEDDETLHQLRSSISSAGSPSRSRTGSPGSARFGERRGGVQETQA